MEKWIMEKYLFLLHWLLLHFPCGSVGKESACNAGYLGSIPGLGRSPLEGKVTHSSILAWRIPWTIESTGSQRVEHYWATFTFTFIDYSKAFDCVDHSKLCKIPQETGVTDRWICFLRNLYASQEETVRTGHRTTYWFQIGKGVQQACISSPCLLNFYAEYIMQNTRLDEAQAGSKIAQRNINNLTYAK